MSSILGSAYNDTGGQTHESHDGTPAVKLFLGPEEQKTERQKEDNEIFRECLQTARDIHMIIEKDHAIKACCLATARFARNRMLVAFRGETGTGKDPFSQLYYKQQLDLAHNGPYTPINLAALSESVIESELFGHEKGAFTGAIQKRESIFLKAGTGTVHLDEIGSLPLQSQVKILRLLENNEVKAVGCDKTESIKCSIVCSTNRNLEKMVEEGQFLEDLYHRIDAHIWLPPWHIREPAHKNLIINYFASQFDVEIDKDVREEIQSKPYRGNVREVKKLIKRAVAFLPQSKPGDRKRITYSELADAQQYSGHLLHRDDKRDDGKKE